MEKFQCINGWTKEKMIAKVLAEFKGKAEEVGHGPYSVSRCAYKTVDGKKCAVGMFIPEGHDAQSYIGTVGDLLECHEGLEKHMPLSFERTFYYEADKEKKSPLQMFQNVHDKLPAYESMEGQRAILIKWIEENVA